MVICYRKNSSTHKVEQSGPAFGRARHLRKKKQENIARKMIFKLKMNSSFDYQSIILSLSPFLNPVWTQALNGIQIRRNSSKIVLRGKKKTYCIFKANF